MIVSFKKQSHTIRTWMNLIASNDKLIMNICHSCRVSKIEWLCSKTILNFFDLFFINTFECEAHDFQIAKETMWNVARIHVRRLIKAIELQIENDMSTQRFAMRREITNKQDWMQSWLIARDSLYLIKKSSFLNQHVFFFRNYVTQIKTHYENENFLYQHDMIAMIVIFFRKINFEPMREKEETLMWEMNFEMSYYLSDFFVCIYFFHMFIILHR